MACSKCGVSRRKAGEYAGRGRRRRKGSGVFDVGVALRCHGRVARAASVSAVGAADMPFCA